jgi:hypothetical protein
MLGSKKGSMLIIRPKNSDMFELQRSTTLAKLTYDIAEVATIGSQRTPIGHVAARIKAAGLELDYFISPLNPGKNRVPRALFTAQADTSERNIKPARLGELEKELGATMLHVVAGDLNAVFRNHVQTLNRLREEMPFNPSPGSIIKLYERVTNVFDPGPP